MTRGLLDCAARNGLLVIDTFEALAAAANPRQLYGQWHMNESGNRLIAKLVAAELLHRGRGNPRPGAKRRISGP